MSAPSAPPAPAPEASFLLDGQPVPCRPGDTLLAAARRAGRYIPHLCWHPDHPPGGSCRLCLVEVDGRPVPACTTAARPGLAAASRTEALQNQRLRLLQLLFVEGNHFCPGCERSGACRLQATAVEQGMTSPHFEAFSPDRPVDASHPDLLLDLNRCILCGLCVRASAATDGKHVFAIGGHGSGAQLLVDSPSGRLGDSAIAAGDAAAAICPVGAILPKRRGFAVPIGRRHDDLHRVSAPAKDEAA